MIIYLASLFRLLLPKNVAAITLWPFIIYRNKEDKTNLVLLNHEKIHLRQQLELLLVPFYIIYIAEYLYYLITFGNHNKAYHNISFEKEAYKNDKDLNYLKNRKCYAMWRNSTGNDI